MKMAVGSLFPKGKRKWLNLSGGVVFLLITHTITAQSVIKGTIRDDSTQASLPFVHLVIDLPGKQGTVSNIDGYFSLTVPAGTDGQTLVLFSCVGYELHKISLSNLRANPDVRMTSKILSIGEVVIQATEDPAYEIIRKAVENRKNNNPENLPHYTYRSYNKASADVDRSGEGAREIDSTGFANARLFMMESATDIEYIRPGKWRETVVASKISGVQNPMFSMLSNSFQPFSVYTNYLNILNFDYLNPVSPGSRQKYIFELVDTVDVQGETAYIIAYQPRINALGRLLKGSLTIGSENYAIVNFRGENVDAYSLLFFEVRQAYAKIDGTWFPKESKTLYRMEDSENPAMLINSTTYNQDIDLKNPPAAKSFGPVQVAQADSAGLVSEDTWRAVRPFELDSNEQNTYLVYDTLPPAASRALTAMVNNVGPLSKGLIPFGKVDINVTEIYRFNGYEGIRLGLGLATNRHFIDWMRAEGYFAYGFRDQRLKYGGGLRFLLMPRREFEITARYRNDVEEPGRSPVLKDIGLMRVGDQFKNWIAYRMNPIEQYTATISYRPARGLYTRGFVIYETRQPEIRGISDFNGNFADPFIKFEYGLEVNFAPGEELSLSQKILTPLNLTYPRFGLRISRAEPGVEGSNQDFYRADLNIQHQFRILRLGDTYVFGGAGKVWANAASYPYLYFGRGAAVTDFLSVLTPGYFQTMDPYAFLMDEQVYGGLLQSLGFIGIEKKYSKPELKLAYQAAIGRLDAANSDDLPFAYRQMNKPYLEGGLIVDNLLRLQSSFFFVGFGGGIFYRHGVYAMPDFEDNVGLILSFAVSI